MSNSPIIQGPVVHIWTPEQTLSLLDTISSNPKYTRILFPHPKHATTVTTRRIRYARNLCLEVLVGTEWMEEMRELGWVRWGTKGHWKIGKKWGYRNNDPVTLRLAELPKLIQHYDERLGGYTSYEDIPPDSKCAKRWRNYERDPQRQWVLKYIALRRKQQDELAAEESEDTASDDEGVSGGSTLDTAKRTAKQSQRITLPPSKRPRMSAPNDRSGIRPIIDLTDARRLPESTSKRRPNPEIICISDSDDEPILIGNAPIQSRDGSHATDSNSDSEDEVSRDISPPRITLPRPRFVDYTGTERSPPLRLAFQRPIDDQVTDSESTNESAHDFGPTLFTGIAMTSSEELAGMFTDPNLKPCQPWRERIRMDEDSGLRTPPDSTWGSTSGSGRESGSGSGSGSGSASPIKLSSRREGRPSSRSFSPPVGYQVVGDEDREDEMDIDGYIDMAIGKSPSPDHVNAEEMDRPATPPLPPTPPVDKCLDIMVVDGPPPQTGPVDDDHTDSLPPSVSITRSHDDHDRPMTPPLPESPTRTKQALGPLESEIDEIGQISQSAETQTAAYRAAIALLSQTLTGNASVHHAMEEQASASDSSSAPITDPSISAEVVEQVSVAVAIESPDVDLQPEVNSEPRLTPSEVPKPSPDCPAGSSEQRQWSGSRWTNADPIAPHFYSPPIPIQAPAPTPEEQGRKSLIDRMTRPGTVNKEQQPSPSGDNMPGGLLGRMGLTSYKPSSGSGTPPATVQDAFKDAVSLSAIKSPRTEDIKPLAESQIQPQFRPQSNSGHPLSISTPAPISMTRLPSASSSTIIDPVPADYQALSQISSSFLSILITQSRISSSPILQNHVIAFTAGHIPLKPKLSELIVVLGGNVVSEGMIRGNPAKVMFVVHPFGWEGYRTRKVNGVSHVEILDFLDLVGARIGGVAA